jgi:SAM-dependent methyltransferase
VSAPAGIFLHPAPNVDGILEYAPLTEERSFYESEYANQTAEPVGDETKHVTDLWKTPYYPVNRIVLAKVGNTRDKVVVSLGQGDSAKELAFALDGPRLLVVTDIAAAGLSALRQRFPRLTKDVVFATIDAQNLPFRDESIDVLYGYAVVHHLSDIRTFLREAARVVKPGGRAIFMDDGYSPVWQWLKLGPCHSLMKRAHAEAPVSPEDVRATMRGGFKEAELRTLMSDLGVTPWFERSCLIHYLVTRAGEKMKLPVQPAHHPWLLRALSAADRGLAALPGIRPHLIRLAWGFTRP